jgi:hypothetical protein
MVWSMRIRGIRDVFYADFVVGDPAFGDSFFSFDDKCREIPAVPGSW